MCLCGCIGMCTGAFECTCTSMCMCVGVNVCVISVCECMSVGVCVSMCLCMCLCACVPKFGSCGTLCRDSMACATCRASHASCLSPLPPSIYPTATANKACTKQNVGGSNMPLPGASWSGSSLKSQMHRYKFLDAHFLTGWTPTPKPGRPRYLMKWWPEVTIPHHTHSVSGKVYNSKICK